MALAFAQNLGDLNTASGTSLSGTFGSSTVSGNLILAAARIGAQGRTQTFSDNKSNTWASNAIELDFPIGNHLSVGYALNITGGASHQLTVSISGAAASIRMVIWEEAGIATASALDKTNTATSASETAVDSGATATTTQADEWLFCVGSFDGSGTPTADAAYGHLIGAPSGTAKKMAAEDRIVAATGAYNGTFSVTAGYAGWGCAIATFKAASGGGTKTVAPASITGTSTMSGTVIAKKTLTTATIAGVSVMSAVVRNIDPVAPATITATSTMSATVRSIDPVVPASILGASTLSVALVFKRAVGAAVITGTSVLGGTISGGSGTGHRHLAPSIVLTAAPAIAPKVGSRAFT